MPTGHLPGSVFEFVDLVEPLTRPPDQADAFDIGFPSLPRVRAVPADLAAVPPAVAPAVGRAAPDRVVIGDLFLER